MGGRRALVCVRGLPCRLGGSGNSRAVASHSSGAVGISVGGGAAHGAIYYLEGRRLSRDGRPEGFCAEVPLGHVRNAWRDGRGTSDGRGALVRAATEDRGAACSD